MKQLIFLTSALLFINSIHAQIQIGIKAGPSLIMNSRIIDAVSPVYKDTIAGFIEEGDKVHFGMNAGIILNKQFSDKISIQTEFLYSVKEKHFLKLQYLSIPILFNYHLNNEMAFHAGPELDVLLFPSLIGERQDVSVNIGMDYQINNLSIDLRYVHGFIPNNTIVFQDGRGEIKGEVYQKNRSLQLSVGYLF